MALLGLPDDPAQQKRFMLGVLPLLLLGAYVYFVQGRYTQQLTDVRTHVERLEAQNASARVRTLQSKQLEDRLVRFEKHIDRLEQLVPRREEVSQLLNQINQTAERVGVEVAVFRPGETTKGPHYDRRTFDLTVYGTYHNIGRLLANIGSLPRIITPLDMNLVPRKEQDRSGGERLQASFVIETYVLPDHPTQPAAQQGGSTGA